MTTAQQEAKLSPFQNEAMTLLLQRMQSYLAWPVNRDNPQRIGFSIKEYSQLSLLTQYPDYATPEKLDALLIPIQDRLLEKIEEKGRKNQQTEEELRKLTANVRPIFTNLSVENPVTDKLTTSYDMTRQQAEDFGYLVSLIANIINPPKARVYYPEFGKK